MSGFKLVRPCYVSTSNTVKPAINCTDYIKYLDRTAGLIMVDTLGLTLDFADIDLPNAIVRVDDSNELGQQRQWAKQSLRGVSGRQSITLSTKTVKVDKEFVIPGGPKAHTQLLVEGSVAMHVQGQNIVSSAEVPMLAYQLFKEVNGKTPLVVPASRKLAIARGLDAEVTRIDVAVMLRVPKALTTAAVINAIAVAAAKARLPMSLYPNETVYFDQHSQYCSGKLYDKAQQLEDKDSKGGNGNISLPLRELASRTIRMEFVFRKKYFRNHPELKGKKAYPVWFTKERLACMLLEQLERISVGGRLPRRLDQYDLLSIPLPYRHSVAHWQNGMSARDFFKSDRTLRQHQSFIKNNFHSIDILGPAPVTIDGDIDLMDLISPDNFVPIPDEIQADKHALFEEDMGPTIERLKASVGSGISGAFVDPYWDE